MFNHNLVILTKHVFIRSIGKYYVDVLTNNGSIVRYKNNYRNSKQEKVFSLSKDVNYRCL